MAAILPWGDELNTMHWLLRSGSMMEIAIVIRSSGTHNQEPIVTDTKVPSQASFINTV